MIFYDDYSVLAERVPKSRARPIRVCRGGAHGYDLSAYDPTGGVPVAAFAIILAKAEGWSDVATLSRALRLAIPYQPLVRV